MDFSFVLPLLVSAVGLFLMVKLRLFFILHPIRTLRKLKDTLKSRETRSALALALAGTLGVGNVFGVCAGLLVGGAGSVFWLWVSAVFSMIIKYAECTLTFDSLHGESGGMYSVISKCFGRAGTHLSSLYALLCALLALFMGSAMQSGAVCDVVLCTAKVSPYVTAPVLLVLVILGVSGGIGKIEKHTAKLIPLTTIIYILLAIGTIFANFRELPRVFRDIFEGAFTPSAAGGGVLSFVFSKSLREGYARGILSNEAGVGTSAMAHARADGRSPAEAGLAGIVEVFFDTVVLCTLTAVAVLSAYTTLAANVTPMSLISFAVSESLGALFLPVLTFSILVFAYSTVICWYFYGTQCSRYLFGRVGESAFAPLFFVFVLVGALVEHRALVNLTDFIILFMSSLTLISILVGSSRIRRLTKDADLL